MAEVEPTETAPKKRPAWFGWAIGGLVVVVAAAGFFIAKAVSGGSSPAAASTGNTPTANGGSGQNGYFQGRFPGAAGKITAINGTTLTLQDQQNQSVKVTTSSSTRITVSKTVAVSDIAKGDRITATGTQSGTTVAATRITIADLQGGNSQRTGGPGGFNGEGGPPPGGFNGQGGPPVTDANGNPTGNASGSTNQRPSGFAGGTVTDINGGTITISSFDGSTMTVTTTSSTTVTKSVQGSFSDLKVGQTVRAMGNTSSDGAVAATSINEGMGGFGAFGGGRRTQQGTP